MQFPLIVGNMIGIIADAFVAIEIFAPRVPSDVVLCALGKHAVMNDFAHVSAELRVSTPSACLNVKASLEHTSILSGIEPLTCATTLPAVEIRRSGVDR